MNQAVIQDGRVDIQSKNVSYAKNGNRHAGRTNKQLMLENGLVQKIKEYDQNVQRILRTESISGKKNVQCYNCNGRGHYARNCPKLRVRDAKYFREQMLLAAKDEARVHLNEEEMTLCFEVNASQIDMINRLFSKSDHEHRHHEKLKTIIHTSTDDQIDSDIIFYDPYVDNNIGEA
ncbi:retrovirus-related pol polyprotein from transposon TNT 1-94 [Tanacetum coccineum]